MMMEYFAIECPQLKPVLLLIGAFKDELLSETWATSSICPLVNLNNMPTHGFTPGKSRFSASKDECQVMLARYRCPYSKEEHDPKLPPEDVNAFGYIRKTK